MCEKCHDLHYAWLSFLQKCVTLCLSPKQFSVVYCSVVIGYKTSWGQSLSCYFQNMGSSCCQCVLCIVPISPPSHCFTKRSRCILWTHSGTIVSEGCGGTKGQEFWPSAPHSRMLRCVGMSFPLGRTEETPRKRGDDIIDLALRKNPVSGARSFLRFLFSSLESWKECPYRNKVCV